MQEIIEAVPNISEGRDTDVIEAIVDSARIDGVGVLHIDRGEDANRTVITLAGPPDRLLEATYALVTATVALIDLRTHRGAHPRVGVTDVCPFVPISGTSMSRCVSLAKELGVRVAQDLSLPVFFYEEAAVSEARRPLPYYRRKGINGLIARMGARELTPDVGPLDPHPSAGALVTGAREILIAYNVHLGTESEEIAKKIATMLRSSSPGGLPAVRAIGWYMNEYRCAEVSCNLLNYTITGLYDVYMRASSCAELFGTSVVGSEIIGLVPRRALVEAGLQVSSGESMSDAELIRAAIDGLRLSTMRGFETKSKILEERLVTEGF